MDSNPYLASSIDLSAANGGSDQNATWRELVRQALGAAVWGVSFSIIPLDILAVSVVVWFPLLIWREVVRSKRYGFKEGALVRLCTVCGLLLAACVAPMKTPDRRVAPLAYRSVTVEELGDRLRSEHGIPCLVTGMQKDVRVSFSTGRSMSIRSVMKNLGQSINGDVVRGGCGNGATLLFGAPTLYYIRTTDKVPASRPAK